MERTYPHRRFGLLLPVLLSALVGQAQNIGINTTGWAPHQSALLDIDADTLAGNIRRGLLIPRMSDTQMNSVIAPATSLLVFNRTANGFYWYDGTAWVPLGGAGAGWGLTGNGLTDETVNFLGTTDNRPLVIRTAGTARLRITTNGQLEPLNNGESVFVGEGAGINDDLTANQNVFVGHIAGNQNTSGASNTALGRGALSNNLSGSSNAAVGSGALEMNVYPNGNTAVGANALQNNTIAQGQTAVGFEALRSNISGQGNAAVGYQSLTNNVSGERNTALGFGALWANTIGSRNTAIGYGSLEFNTGWQNTAIGDHSLNQNTWAGGNTAIGSETMRYNTSGDNNVAIGFRTLGQNTTGWRNVALGSHSMYDNITGSANTAVGDGALRYNQSGGLNTAVGCASMSQNITGGHNTAVGRSSLATNQTGSGNVGVGDAALFGVQESFNTGIGCEALSNQIDGENNVGIGRAAGGRNTSGRNNVFLGAYSGGLPFIGPTIHRSGNVFIGFKAGYNELDSNKLYIENTESSEPLIYGEFDTDMVRINHNLGIGSSWFGGGTRVLSFEPGIQPVSDPGHAMIFSQLQSGIAELLTMDGSGNTQPISPHHFSLAPRSEPMAWSFYSENAKLGRKVNVDMMRAVRLIEQLSGEQLVYMNNMKGGEVAQLKRENDSLVERVARLEKKLACIEAAIGQTHDKHLRRASARKP